MMELPPNGIVPILPTVLDQSLDGAPPGIPLEPGPQDVITQCPRCGRDCWIKPVQWAMAELLDIKPVCYYCALDLSKGFPGVQTLRIPIDDPE